MRHGSFFVVEACNVGCCKVAADVLTEKFNLCQGQQFTGNSSEGVCTQLHSSHCMSYTIVHLHMQSAACCMVY